MKCIYCPKETDLRPFGPRGAWVCFKCAMETPDRKAEAEHNFGVQLEACGPVAVAGGESGPYPIEHAEPELRAAWAAISASRGEGEP